MQYCIPILDFIQYKGAVRVRAGECQYGRIFFLVQVDSWFSNMLDTLCYLLTKKNFRSLRWRQPPHLGDDLGRSNVLVKNSIVYIFCYMRDMMSGWVLYPLDSSSWRSKFLQIIGAHTSSWLLLQAVHIAIESTGLLRSEYKQARTG